MLEPSQHHVVVVLVQKLCVLEIFGILPHTLDIVLGAKLYTAASMLTGLSGLCTAHLTLSLLKFFPVILFTRTTFHNYVKRSSI